MLPRLSRIPVDSHGNYIKEARQDDTYPYLAFALDDFDDGSAQQLLLMEAEDEFAVVMHVRSMHKCSPFRRALLSFALVVFIRLFTASS